MPLRQLDFNLIPRVGAAGADGVAQPTFGILDVGVTPGQQSSISLTANSTSVFVGNTFDVEIEIKTNAFTINEYRLIVDFDTTKLSVVDAKPTEPGTQITFLDTVFQVDGTNNNVSSAGRITLIAKTPSGNALQVNRKVARITFQPQQTGSTTITPVAGATGSQLINQNGVAIASTLNSININVTTQSQTATTSTTSSIGNAGSTTTATSSAGGVTTIPDTGIVEDLATYFPVFLGVFLLSLGLVLRQSRKKHEE